MLKENTTNTYLNSLHNSENSFNWASSKINNIIETKNSNNTDINISIYNKIIYLIQFLGFSINDNTNSQKVINILNKDLIIKQFLELVKSNISITIENHSNSNLDIDYENIIIGLNGIIEKQGFNISNTKEEIINIYNYLLKKSNNKGNSDDILIGSIKKLEISNNKILINLSSKDIIQNHDLFKKLNNIDNNTKSRIIINISGNNILSNNNEELLDKINILELTGFKVAYCKITGKRINIENMLESIDTILLDEDGKKIEDNSDNEIFLLKEIQKNKNNFSLLLKDFPDFKKNIYTKQLEKTTIEYIAIFFNFIEDKLKYDLKYEKVTTKDWDIYFNEALIRIEPSLSKKYDITHIDILDIYSKFGKEFEIFKKVLEKVYYSIQESKILGQISINIEVSDLLNNNFIKELQKYKNIKHNIIFEILENQEIPINNILFIKNIKEAKKLGYKFALDDVFSEQVPIKQLFKNIDSIGKDNISIVKIDGNIISNLYYLYSLLGKTSNNIINKFKKEIEKISKKDIIVIAEFIDNKEKRKFVLEKLGIDYFQGYYIQDNINQREKIA